MNKVATKVELRLHLDSASWLAEDIKQKFREKHPLTKEGFFIVRSGKTTFSICYTEICKF